MHDEMCRRPMAYNCDCELIATVRENERTNIANAIDQFANVFGSISAPMLKMVAEMARSGKKMV